MVELRDPRPVIHSFERARLRIIVDRPLVYLAREDVEAIAGVPPWGTGEQLIVDDEASFQVAGVEYSPLEAAMNRVRDDGTDPDRAEKFLAWLSEVIPHVTDPKVLGPRPNIAPIEGSWTVEAAARVLRRRTGAALTRPRLFDLMEALHWVERNPDSTQWIITALPHNNGWLTAHEVLAGPKGRGKGHRYLQVYVRPPGIDELARILTAEPLTATTGSHAGTSPTLFD